MVCLVFEPGTAGWWARTKPLSYDGPLLPPSVISWLVLDCFLSTIEAHQNCSIRKIIMNSKISFQVRRAATFHCRGAVAGSSPAGTAERGGTRETKEERTRRSKEEKKKTFHVRLSEGHKAFHGAAEGARGGRGGEIYCR